MYVVPVLCSLHSECMFSWSNLYFESLIFSKSVLQAIGLLGQRDAIRLDLTRHGLRVEKAKVGPLGSLLFDSAVSISSSTE